MKFRKKPTVVQAVQFDGMNADECRLLQHRLGYLIKGQASALVSPGDWILTLENGVRVVMSNSRFLEEYEPIHNHEDTEPMPQDLHGVDQP